MMKISISNIAWEDPYDAKVFSLLKEKRIKGIEIAPTKFWPDWQNITKEELLHTDEFFKDQGFEIPALQAILYGKNHFSLFTKETRIKEEMKAHFHLLGEIASSLGAKRLVFGSPRNRKRDAIPYTDALAMATECFRELAEITSQYNVSILIEPNPKIYNCDFINNTDEAMDLVSQVNHDHFGLHMDIGAMSLENENILQSIEKSVEIIRYFHASEKNLGSFNPSSSKHEQAAKALNSFGYDGWVSIEMAQTDNYLSEISQAIDYVKGVYLG